MPHIVNRSRPQKLNTRGDAHAAHRVRPIRRLAQATTMRFRPVVSFLSVLVAGLPACSRQSDSREQVSSVAIDSAGVQIITSTGPQPAPLREGFGLTLDLRIGVTEGDERNQFFNVLEIAVHPSSGDILVADGGSGVMRVFNAEGAWLRTLGRNGEGPGETTRPATITFLGDSVFAVTGSNYQAVMFDDSGRWIRQTPLMNPLECCIPSAGHRMAGSSGHGLRNRVPSSD